jgi:hypothetical protein
MEEDRGLAEGPAALLDEELAALPATEEEESVSSVSASNGCVAV